MTNAAMTRKERTAINKRKLALILIDRLICVLFWGAAVWWVVYMANSFQGQINEIDAEAARQFADLYKANEEIRLLLINVLFKLLFVLLIPLIILYGIINLFGYGFELRKQNGFFNALAYDLRRPIKARWQSKMRMPVYKVRAAAPLANADR
jgi:nucleoside permease NupC